MNTSWICRILTVVFLLNTLPVEVFAQYMPRKFDQKALEEQISKKSVEQLRQEEKAELERVLQAKDLSPRERKFVELELEIVNTEIEVLERQASSNNVDFINKLPGVYAPRLEVLHAREGILEQEEALNDFYQKAESLTWIGAAVAAMHTYTENANKVAATQDREYANAKASLEPFKLIDPLRQPTTPGSLSLGGAGLVTINGSSVEQPVDVLAQWENNEIGIEDLVEYVDPIGKLNFSATSDAAELLYMIFLSYNSNSSQLDEETKGDALWLAKRLKHRVTHQLVRLDSSIVQARANLMLLLIQVNAFLDKYYKETAEQTQKDRTMEGFDMIARELNQGLKLYPTWNVGNVTQSLVNQVKQELKDLPSQDSAEFEFLRRDLSVLVSYLMMTGEQNSISDILTLLNKDGKTYHGKHEALVTEFISAIYDVMINLPVSYNQQQYVQNLLICAASPKCTYLNGKEISNAVNVRAQAIGLASLLKQAAEAHTSSVSSIFTNADFRTNMANYTVDVYAPTVEYNAHKQYSSQITKYPIERYGMELDELQKFSDVLTDAFVTFLPVPEPKVTFEKETSGLYRECSIRKFHNTDQLMYAQTLKNTDNGSFNQLNPVDEDGVSNTSVKCSDHMSISFYGGYDTVIVYDSAKNKKAMKKTTLEHKYLAAEDFATTIMWEAFTWYLWGAAFKAVGYAWKFGKAALVATKTAAKARSGMRIARFESKFSQAWKYYTNGWKSEMGIVNMSKQGGKYVVEMARPGMKTLTVTIEGVSTRTLKGRVLFRRALQRKVLDGAARTTTKGSRATTRATATAREFATPMTKAEQKAVALERPFVKAVNQELASGNSFNVVRETQSGAKLYSPVSAERFIDVATGMPEKLTLDAATGNMFGEVSGAYVGTAVPAGQTVSAYNVAAGLLGGGTSMSPRLIGRYLWNSPSILGGEWGTKMLLTMMAADYPAYYLYLKPYTENFAKRQEDYFSKKYGLNQSQLTGENDDGNPLTRLQTLTSNHDDPSWAAMSAGFMAFNQGLNLILPKEAPSWLGWMPKWTQLWTQSGRQDSFGKVNNLIETIDGPIKDKVGETIPTPAQIMLMPAILVSDPTPTIEDGSATDEQYRQTAHNQRLQRAMDGHDAKVYQESLDKEIAQIQSASEQFLKEGGDVANFLKALPNGKKEMKTAYQVYIQKLKEARQLAETDIAKAQKLEEESSKTFLNTQASIMKRAIKAYLVAEKPETMKKQIEIFANNFNTSAGAEELEEEAEDPEEEVVIVGKARNFFKKKQKNALEKIVNEYYKKKEQYLVDFYTAPSQSLKTNQDVDALQKTAQQNLDQLEKDVDAQLRALQNSLSSKVLESHINVELKTIGGNENTIGSMKNFLSEDNNAAMLQALPDGEKRIKLTYKAYEGALGKAKGIVKQNPEKADEMIQDAVAKFINTRTNIMCEGVHAYARLNREQELKTEVEGLSTSANIFLREGEKSQLENMINNYWKGWEESVTEFYRAQQRAVLHPEEAEEAGKAQEVALLKIKQLEQDITDGITNLRKTIQQRIDKYEQKRQAAY